MSTEVEQQQPTVAPIEQNGEPVVEAPATAANGEHKTEEKKNGHVKEVEPPKDPLTDTIGWMKDQPKEGIHKANFYLLDWYISETFAEDDANKPVMPESGFVKNREFIEKVKDGVVLARFANIFEPGSVETVKEGEDAKTEENQKANVEAFITFAKKHLAEDQVFTFDDLKKGKAEHAKVFLTLFQLMTKSTSDSFKRPRGDFDRFVKEVTEVVPKKFLQKVLGGLNTVRDQIMIPVNSFSTFALRPFKRSNSNVQQPEQPAENGATTNGTTEETHENGVSNGTKVEEKKEEVPAVAAN